MATGLAPLRAGLSTPGFSQRRGVWSAGRSNAATSLVLEPTRATSEPYHFWPLGSAGLGAESTVEAYHPDERVTASWRRDPSRRIRSRARVGMLDVGGLAGRRTIRTVPPPVRDIGLRV